MQESPERPPIVIDEGPRPDAREAVVAMHADYYSKAWRFGAFFEAKVAKEFAEFLSHYDRARDRIFLALCEGRIVGSLIVDGGGTSAATHGAHLRWFVVDEAHHGRGAGKTMMTEAMKFLRAHEFARCYLTTFRRTRFGPCPVRAGRLQADR